MFINVYCCKGYIIILGPSIISLSQNLFLLATLSNAIDSVGCRSESSRGSMWIKLNVSFARGMVTKALNLPMA